MTYLITLVSMVVLTKSNLIYKNIIIFCSSIIGVNYFIKAKSIQEFMLVIFEGKKDFTYSVRLDSQVHFLDKWKSNLGTILFGYGYPNSNRIESNIATGATQGYLLADNGMYGYLMCYGILGIMVYILYLIKFLIRAIKIYIKNRDCKLIAIFISILTGIATNGGFFITFYSFETILIMILSDIIWSESYNNKYDSRS